MEREVYGEAGVEALLIVLLSVVHVAYKHTIREESAKELENQNKKIGFDSM